MNFLLKKIKSKNKNGFTIVELIVSLTIFAVMTALVLSKYGKFNQGVLLTNLAYDVALNIRNAQSYGLNVKSADRYNNVFDATSGGGSYGVHFDKADMTHFVFFFDANSNGLYDDLHTSDLKTSIQRGSSIKNLCVSNASDCTTSPTVNTLDISFKRPDPNANIMINGDRTLYGYAEITLQATDGTTKSVIVNSTGQISVK